jgi:adenylate kinase
MHIVFFGPPGSGKGTQSKLVSEHLGGVPIIATGDILRAEAKKGGDFGQMIEKVLSSGEMLDDDIMQDILQEKLAEGNCWDSFILDGFPRNVEQAVYLDRVLEQRDSKIDRVIVINLNSEVLVKRTTGRFQCAKCKTIYNKYFFNVKEEGICDNCRSTDFIVRADDLDEKTIRRRIDIYRKTSDPVIEFYEKKNLTYFVDGTQSPEDMYQDILRSFDKRI